MFFNFLAGKSYLCKKIWYLRILFEPFYFGILMSISTVLDIFLQQSALELVGKTLLLATNYPDCFLVAVIFIHVGS